MDDKCVYFYSKNSPFSQHFQTSIIIDDKTFNCAEQYYMYRKAMTFGDVDTANSILLANSPTVQKHLGKCVKGFNQNVWDRVAVNVVKKVSYEKFTQSYGLMKFLINTYPKRLVEASPYDRKWGVGLSIHDPNIRCVSQWCGQNLLGDILSNTRKCIMNDMSVRVCSK